MATEDIESVPDDRGAWNGDVVVILHGGNFTGGSPTWDADTTKVLTGLGLKVVRLGFPTTRGWDAVETYVHTAITGLKARDDTKRLFVVGVSSGGFVAAWAHGWDTLVDGTVCVCPVLRPAVQAELVPDLKAGARDMFGPDAGKAQTKALVNRLADTSTRPIAILTGEGDTRCPHTVSNPRGIFVDRGSCAVLHDTHKDVGHGLCKLWAQRHGEGVIEFLQEKRDRLLRTVREPEKQSKKRPRDTA